MMRVRQRHVLAWCLPCLPVAALGLPLVVYLPPYYAGTLGLPLATVGFIFAVVRLLDIPVDPLLGALMDNSRSRFGQFRPWMVAGGFVLAAGVWLMFMAAPGVTALQAFLSLFLLYIGWSLVFLSQTAWGSRLSGDYAERARIFGWWTAANAFATLLVLAIPPLTARFAPEAPPSAAIQAIGWFILALIPLSIALAAWLVPEGEGPSSDHRVTLPDVARLVKDGRMQLLLALDLLLSVIPGLAGALFLFFLTAARGVPLATASGVLLFYFIAGLLGAAFWVRVAARLGKHRAIALAALWLAGAQIMVVTLPFDNLALAAFAFFCAGVPIGAPPFLLRAMLADLNDAQALDARDRREGQASDTTGLSYAILTATQKLGYAIPVGLTYPLLALIGFDPAPGAANSEAAIEGLTLLYVLPSVTLGLLAAWLAWRWPITADAHARIRARLAERPA
jgi:Na+/melibiose symporter-like transporter